MSNLDLQKGRRQALAVVLSQALLGTIVAIACFRRGCACRRLGAARRGHRGGGDVPDGVRDAAAGEGASLTRVTLGFFSGWLVKVGFTVALMVMAFRSPKVDAVPLLAAYVATFFGYWFGAARPGGPATNGYETVGVGNRSWPP